MAYIDVRELKLDVQRSMIPTADEVGMVSVNDADRHFIKLIERQPIVDAVKVVRCRDCEYHETYTNQWDNTMYFCMRTIREVKVKENDFCSYGREINR